MKFTIIGCNTPGGSKNITRTFNTFRLVGSKLTANLRISLNSNLRISSNSNLKRSLCSSHRIPKIFVGVPKFL